MMKMISGWCHTAVQALVHDVAHNLQLLSQCVTAYENHLDFCYKKLHIDSQELATRRSLFELVSYKVGYMIIPLLITK